MGDASRSRAEGCLAVVHDRYLRNVHGGGVHIHRHCRNACGTLVDWGYAHTRHSFLYSFWPFEGKVCTASLTRSSSHMQMVEVCIGVLDADDGSAVVRLRSRRSSPLRILIEVVQGCTKRRENEFVG